MAASALALSAFPTLRPGRRGDHGGERELVVMAVLYVAVVALMRAAFVGFGTSRVPPPF